MAVQDQVAYTNVPSPDPSILTTETLNRSRDELRIELAAGITSLKEMLITRLDGMDKASLVLAENVNRVPTLLDREILRVTQLFEERFTSVHNSFNDRDRLFDERFGRINTEFVDRDRLMDEKFESVKSEFRDHDSLFSEKFGSIQLQFRERDVRTDQDKLAATTAVNAALQAQKEAAGAQNIANAAAINKSETGFTKEIDGLKELITTTKDALTAQIVNVNSRLDRGEGNLSGQKEKTEAGHMTTGTVMGVIGGVVGVLALLATIIFGVVTSINKNASGIEALRTRPESLYLQQTVPQPLPAPPR